MKSKLLLESPGINWVDYHTFELEADAEEPIYREIGEALHLHKWDLRQGADQHPKADGTISGIYCFECKSCPCTATAPRGWPVGEGEEPCPTSPFLHYSVCLKNEEGTYPTTYTTLKVRKR